MEYASLVPKSATVRAHAAAGRPLDTPAAALMYTRMATATDEIATGKRFDFGRNWNAFASAIGEPNIASAESALAAMVGTEELRGRRFLDVGSGSGLMSLAARRLGALVRSFDYDPGSVECTRALRDRYAAEDPGWSVEHGSIVDDE